MVAKNIRETEDINELQTSETSAVIRSLRPGHWYSITIISIGQTYLTNQLNTDLETVQTGYNYFVR